jgi:hypothetical protein
MLGKILAHHVACCEESRNKTSETDVVIDIKFKEFGFAYFSIILSSSVNAYHNEGQRR